MKILKIALLSKKAKHAAIVKDLKNMGTVLKSVRKMLMRQFLSARKDCKYRKRTKWSFQKTSCGKPGSGLYRNIGSCLFDRCPVINLPED